MAGKKAVDAETFWTYKLIPAIQRFFFKVIALRQPMIQATEEAHEEGLIWLSQLPPFELAWVPNDPELRDEGGFFFLLKPPRGDC